MIYLKKERKQNIVRWANLNAWCTVYSGSSLSYLWFVCTLSRSSSFVNVIGQS